MTRAMGLGCSRRSFLLTGLAVPILAQERKGAAFPSEIKRYDDPSTDFDVFRLTDPAHSSIMPASYNRAIARNSSWMLIAAERNGPPQAFRLDLKSGETKELTEAKELDGTSLTFTPDYRSFCYFDGRALFISNLTGQKRQLYEVPEGWERCEGLTVGPDGTHATFGEKRGTTSRLRMVAFGPGTPRTVVEVPFVMSHPIPRPMRAQVLFRQGAEALWMVNSDGTQKRQLKTAPGRVGPADWSPDGRTLLYLGYPEDPKQLNTIREHTPDTNADKAVAKTSQFVQFGFNHDTSVFVGISGSVASPVVLLLLRVTQRERVLCEHKASHPGDSAPRFSPDAQRIYFQSDQHGKPAIYCMHVERMVEKTDSGPATAEPEPPRAGRGPG